jgi:hypothetical protein
MIIDKRLKMLMHVTETEAMLIMIVIAKSVIVAKG